MVQIEVWRWPRRDDPPFAPSMWRFSTGGSYLDEQKARKEAQRLANAERHPYRVVSSDTGREVGRFTGEF